jgi:hypothetical protein
MNKLAGSAGAGAHQFAQASLRSPRRPHGELSQRFPLLTNFRNYMRPAHLVEGSGGSEVLEWNGVQGIDAIEKKYPDCGDITGDLGHTFKEFESNPLATSGNFLPDECARDIHREPCLGDSSAWPPTSRPRGEHMLSILRTSSGVSGASVSRSLFIESARGIHRTRSARKLRGNHVLHAPCAVLCLRYACARSGLERLWG